MNANAFLIENGLYVDFDIIYSQDYSGYRRDPVPYTGRNRHGYSKYFRKIKTTQERRMFFKYKKYCRGKRSYRMLPDSWDDILRNIEKNWKKYRKTQWKEKCETLYL